MLKGTINSIDSDSTGTLTPDGGAAAIAFSDNNLLYKGIAVGNPVAYLMDGATATDLIKASTIITDNRTGNLEILTGESIFIDGATIFGNVLISGGDLALGNAAVIDGTLVGTEGANVVIATNSQVVGQSQLQSVGSVSIKNAIMHETVNTEVVAGDAIYLDSTFMNNLLSDSASGETRIDGNSISENVRANKNNGEVNVNNNTISANLKFEENAGEIRAGSNDIAENVRVMSNQTKVTLDGNSITENVRSTGNTAEVDILNNDISENIRLQDNTSTVRIDGNTITENVRSKNDSVVIVNDNEIDGSLMTKDTPNLAVTNNSILGNFRSSGTTGCNNTGNTVGGSTDGCPPIVDPQ